MGEINWVVSLLIGVIISIPIGILTNIITPLIQDKIEKATLSTQKKKLERLRKEFNEVKELYDDQKLLSIKTAKFLVSGLRTILLSMTVIFLIIGWFILKDSITLDVSSIAVLVGIYFLVLFAEYNQIGEFGRIIVRLLNYKSYKKDVDQKIKELTLKDKEINGTRR